MFEKSLGATLSAARKKKKMTQVEACKSVQSACREGFPLTQATLSAWEKDRQRPSENHMPALRALWENLHISYSLDELLENQVTNKVPANHSQYHKDLATYLDGIQEDTEIWLFSLSHISVLHSQETIRAWVDNIGNGCDYFIVIPLSYIEDIDLSSEYKATIEELSKNLVRNDAQKNDTVKGKLTIYIIDEGPENRSAAFHKSIRKGFETLKDWALGNENSFIKGNVKITYLNADHGDEKSTEDQRLTAGLVNGMVPPCGRLAVYLKKSGKYRKISPQATLMMYNSRYSINSEQSTIYIWLDPHEAERIGNNIQLIKKLV